MSDYIKRMDNANCFVDVYQSVCKDMETDKHRWTNSLRQAGYKASHPNDGWVDWEKHEVTFCYPQFNDCAGKGDKVVLGWPFSKPGELRYVRLLDRNLSRMGIVTWKFEEIVK